MLALCKFQGTTMLRSFTIHIHVVVHTQIEQLSDSIQHMLAFFFFFPLHQPDMSSLAEKAPKIKYLFMADLTFHIKWNVKSAMYNSFEVYNHDTKQNQNNKQ